MKKHDHGQFEPSDWTGTRERTQKTNQSKLRTKPLRKRIKCKIKSNKKNFLEHTIDEKTKYGSFPIPRVVLKWW
jgi:hypothetical protein